MGLLGPRFMAQAYRNLGALSLSRTTLDHGFSFVQATQISSYELNSTDAYFRSALRWGDSGKSTLRLMAISAYAAGDFPKTERLAQLAIESGAPPALIHFMLGYMYSQTQRYDLALESWRQTGEIPIFAQECLRAYYDLGAAAAVEKCRLVSLLNPLDLPVEGHLVLAMSEYGNGRKEDAEAEYVAATYSAEQRQYDYEIALAYGELGVFYHREKQFTKSINALVKSLSHSPDNPYYRIWLGAAYKEAGMPNQAEVEWRKAHETDAMVYRALAAVRLAQLYQTEGEMDRAEDLLEEAVILDPTNVEYHGLLVQAYLNSGQLDNAQSECKAVLDIQPLNDFCRQLLEEGR